jgi:glucose-6-phosphate isomerase
MQQLRDGRDDFFVLFVGVHRDHAAAAVDLDGVTLGDVLFASLEGTRNALYERGRESITLTIPDVSPRSLGALVALFERAVGLYAELIGVNGYNQPGVDKHVAEDVLSLQRRIMACLKSTDVPLTAEQVAALVGCEDQVEAVYRLLEHLSRDSHGRVLVAAGRPFTHRFALRAVGPPEPAHQDNVVVEAH